MKKIVFIILFLSFFNVKAQYTLIPDANFEIALILEDYDDVQDGQVLTSNINTITELDVCCSSISDLTGINDFVALVSLEIDSNQLTSFDISNLENLVMLDCEDNQLTSIDVSNNTALMYLTCENNLLTNVDVSENINLEQLWCYNNQITEIDLSQNIHLNELHCGNNPLTFINIQNGNTDNISDFKADNIASDLCIQVDNATLATNASTSPYNTWVVSSTAQFSEDCSAVGIADFLINTIYISPNVITGLLQIKGVDANDFTRAEIYDTIGNLVKVSDTLNFDVLNLDTTAYFVKIILFDGSFIVKKIIINR